MMIGSEIRSNGSMHGCFGFVRKLDLSRAKTDISPTRLESLLKVG